MTEKKTSKKGSPIQIVLTVLLVGAAFAIGSMWTELRMYKGEGKPAAKQEAAAPEEKEEGVEITEEVWGELVGGGVMKGEDRAAVTIVEFTDYQCPFCKRYVDEAYQQIEADYIATGKVKYVLRDLPLAFHANAQGSAEAARCAGDQGQYWEYHDKLFETQAAWSEATDTSIFKGYAGQLGLDQVAFDACMDEGKFTQLVKDDLTLAQKVGANGTPTFFINGKVLVGAQPFEAFKAILDQELGN